MSGRFYNDEALIHNNLNGNVYLNHPAKERDDLIRGSRSPIHTRDKVLFLYWDSSMVQGFIKILWETDCIATS